MSDYTKQLLDEILVTHSPCGREEEVEEICLRRFAECCDEVWRDAHANIIGKINGASSADAIGSDVISNHETRVSSCGPPTSSANTTWTVTAGSFDRACGGLSVTVMARTSSTAVLAARFGVAGRSSARVASHGARLTSSRTLQNAAAPASGSRSRVLRSTRERMM